MIIINQQEKKFTIPNHFFARACLLLVFFTGLWFLAGCDSNKDASQEATDQGSNSAKALQPGPLYAIKHFSLRNGLKVYVIENPRIPVVFHMIVYHVGSADDPLGKSGLAHYLEHMMFKGPKDSASTNLQKFVRKVGGVYNATTSYDSTNYFEIVPTQHLDTIMAIEAERLEKLIVLDEEVAAERQVIIEERFMRLENEPFQLFIEAMHSTFYAHHPYRIHPIGWLEEMKGLTAQDVRDFHAKWYSVDNAFIIMAGDITLAKAEQLVKKHFGTLKPRGTSTQNRVKEPPRRTRQNITMTSKQIASPYLLYMFKAPKFDASNPAQSLALELGVFGLFNHDTGRLYQRLVEDLKVASHLFANYDSMRLDHAEFQIYAQAAEGVSPDELKVALERELQKELQTTFSQEELQTYKTQILSDLDYLKDSLTAGATGMVAAGLIIKAPLETIENWPTLLKQISAQNVHESLSLVLKDPHYLTGQLLPETQEVNGVKSDQERRENHE